MMSEAVSDVAVVGAGPSGATCAWYLATRGLRVNLYDKAVFPRDKFCGDAVVPLGQKHLRRMGVLQELFDNNEAVYTTSGGFISPSGYSCIGSSSDNPRGKVMAVKRLHLDARIAWAAKRAGAELVEGTPIEHTEFDGKHWTLKSGAQSFQARVLVLADGAHSKAARALKIVNTTPQAMCSRAFVEGGSHAFRRDGICYMTKDLLPGYAAIFRHPNDELNFCTYIIPGGKAQPSDLSRFHHDLLEHNAFVRHHLGPSYKIEKMKGAWLRLGGIPKSYGDQMLIAGDAAGHIDPLTGEGIHLAMEAGFLAASTLGRAFSQGRLDAKSLSAYQKAWKRSFGNQFPIAELASKAMARVPELVDTLAVVAQEKGPEFFLAWADMMTGEASWSKMLQPKMAVPLAAELGRQIWEKRGASLWGSLPLAEGLRGPATARPQQGDAQTRRHSQQRADFRHDDSTVGANDGVAAPAAKADESGSARAA